MAVKSVYEETLALAQRLDKAGSLTSEDEDNLRRAKLLLPGYIANNQIDPQKRAELTSAFLSALMKMPTPDDDDDDDNVNLIADILIELLETFTWEQCRLLSISESLLVSGLNSQKGFSYFNKLTITLLERATENKQSIAEVANMESVVPALVMLWLKASAIGVSVKASQTLLDLLRADQNPPGAMWNRIFNDRNVYNLFFRICAPKTLGNTFAQSRLLAWLPDIAHMNWTTVVSSHCPEVESEYGIKGGGLLDFASLHMIDDQDELMQVNLVEYYIRLLKSNQAALSYLQGNGSHDRILNKYYQGVQWTFLLGPIVEYITTYITLYPNHTDCLKTANTLNKTLCEEFRRANFIHNDQTPYHISILSSLPRKALMRKPWSSSSLSLLTTQVTTPKVLYALAEIFSGDAASPGESSAARALYYKNLSMSPNMWKDIVAHARSVALVDLALAAIAFITAIINAPWPSSAKSPPEDYSARMSPPHGIATPETGTQAILAPPALEFVLPFLLEDDVSFLKLGVMGDERNSAQRVADAKRRALESLATGVQALIQSNDHDTKPYEMILGTITQRLARRNTNKQDGGLVAEMATEGV